MTARLAVLLSGSGRTLLNLLDRIDDGSLDAEIVLVIASRACLGAERAGARGLDTLVEPGEIPTERLAGLLDDARTDLALCAGYLRYVNVPVRYAGRILNIHPALLPLHGGDGMYGGRVHRAVLDAGDTESGCTVHVVDDEFDHGPVVVQKRCPVLPDDTPDTLADRVFALEREAYPEAINLVLGRLRNTARPAASNQDP